MAIATVEQYGAMLDGAAAGGYAFPGVNVSSSQTLNAALRGFAEAGSDGIVQVSTGGAQYLSGAVGDLVAGARALQAFAQDVAERCPVLIALHTDHCPPDKLDDYLRPLLTESLDRRARGEQPLFHSQMFDGSTLPLEENLRIAADLLQQCVQAGVVLEIECGVVGGEEDGMRAGGPHETLYTTPEDLLRVAEVVGTGASAAATCWRRRSATSTACTRPGTCSCAPRPRRRSGGPRRRPPRRALSVRLSRWLWLVAGRDPRGGFLRVVKMNIDSDTQYAFTRAVAGRMFANYDGVLKVDGALGRKQAYDPRSWGREAEGAMAARVAEACQELGSAGRGLLSTGAE